MRPHPCSLLINMKKKCITFDIKSFIVYDTTYSILNLHIEYTAIKKDNLFIVLTNATNNSCLKHCLSKPVIDSAHSDVFVTNRHR